MDDGSPDGTGAILDEYAARDKRIKVIHQANGGLSAARNAALDVAQGEWLYYLDSDDLMAPNALNGVLKAWEHSCDADLIWGMKVEFADGEICHWSTGTNDVEVVDISKELYSRHFGCYFVQYFYRRSTFRDLRFVGHSWGEERPYLAKCMARAMKIAEIDSCIYGFRVRTGSITHSGMTLLECNGFLDATRDVIRILAGSGKIVEPRLMKSVVCVWMEPQVGNIIEYLAGDNQKKAFAYWLKSLKELVTLKGVPPWFRFTASICRILPFLFVARVLCYWPRLLKINVVPKLRRNH